MDTMDRAAAKQLAQITKGALADATKEFGVDVSLGRGTFDPTSGTYTVKVTFALADAEERTFAQEAPLFDLEPSDYGRVFKLRGQEFKLVGFNLRAPKFPVLAEDRSGKRFKLTEAVIELIKKEKSA